MSFWQKSLYLIPRETFDRMNDAEQHQALDCFKVSSADFDSAEAIPMKFWISAPPIELIGDFVSKYLPEAEAWSEECKAWGHSKSDRVEVWPEVIEWIFDTRKISDTHVQCLVLLANNMNCYIADGDGLVASSEPQVIQRILAK